MKGKQYFEVRAFPDNRDQYDTFKSLGFIAIGWPKVRDVSGKTGTQIREELLHVYPNLQSRPKIVATQITNYFLKLIEMKIDDVILIPYKGKFVTIARVTEPYSYKSEFTSDDMTHQVGIEIIRKISLTKIDKSLRNRLRARLTITRFDKIYYPEIDALIDGKDLSEHEKFNKDMSAIIEEYTDKAHPIVKNSLLLSAFSLCENYLTKVILSKFSVINHKNDIPTSNADELLKMYGEESLRKKLRNHNERITIFNKIFKSKLKFPSDKQQALRNSLAHSISEPYISLIDENMDIGRENEIITFQYKKKETEENINNLLNEFEFFSDNLDKII
ncbi:hypothetical protein ABID30_002929 [Enterococcus rotai]|uniref:hypothetical protein n=1 Tax=Enterococcus rotai TaxID=118060 RepID=UPI003398BC17